MLISVIIPTFNDEVTIAATLAQLSTQPGDCEVIIVDGGSTDNTLDWVKDPVKIVPLPGKRGGSLLNAGAAAARGEVLLFLWANSRLPSNALWAIEHNLQLLPQTIGGNFHLKFDKDTSFTRWLAHRLKQQRYLGHYDGHSGIFIRREVFQALEGCRSSDLLADFDLAQRMEAYGPTVYLPEVITAPAPKLWGRNNILRTLLRGLIMPALFRLVIHPSRLATFLGS